MQWIIFLALSATAAGVLINEFLFAGKLFPSSAAGLASGMLVLAIFFATRTADRYRYKLGVAARDVAIWAIIIAAIAVAYWALARN